MMVWGSNVQVEPFLANLTLNLDYVELELKKYIYGPKQLIN